MASTKNSLCVKKNGIWVAKDGSYEPVKIWSVTQSGNLFYIEGRRFAVWQCDCGTFWVSKYENVLRGKVKSCGCFRKEIARKLNQKATRKKRKMSVEQKSIIDFQSKVFSGSQIGKRTVCGVPFRLKFNGRSHNHVVCFCSECGNFLVCSLSDLKEGRQCRACYLKSHTTHGRTGQRLFKIWQKMIERCTAGGSRSKRYGDRGIRVCEEWNNYETFHDWSMKNGYREDLTIDRQDNDLGYSPENCRWVTMLIQANNKSNNVKIKAFGETKNLSQWSRDVRCVVDPQTIQNRIASGLHPEKAITNKGRSKCRHLKSHQPEGNVPFRENN